MLSTALGEDVIISLENIEDCNRYLWGEVGGERVRKSVDKLLDIFQVDRGTSLRPITVSEEREKERERERERETKRVGFLSKVGGGCHFLCGHIPQL